MDKILHSFKSFGRLFHSFAAWKIKVCLPQFVLGRGKRISLERLVLYEWTAWVLVKLKLKSVSPIRHLWIAMQRWKNLLVDSDFKSTILDKTVEKIVYLDSIFLNIVAVPFLPSPPTPESYVFKRKPDPWTFVGTYEHCIGERGFLSAKASFWK